MEIKEFKAKETVCSETLLKDGRRLLTTKNGFVHWVVSKKGVVEEVTEDYYKKCLANRETKKGKRLKK